MQISAILFDFIIFYIKWALIFLIIFMKLNYISTEKLRTWNSETDKKIWFLLGTINWELNDLLDAKWGVSCSKIDQAIKNNSYWFSEDILNEIQSTLNIVRESIWANFDLSFKLKSASSLIECEEIIAKLWNEFELNIYTFNNILSKCSSIEEGENTISKYWKNIELNIFSFSTIFKILINDKNNDKVKTKSLIKDILVKINELWVIDDKNEFFLKWHVKNYSYNWEYNSFIIEVINDMKLTNLNFLLNLLTPQVKKSSNYLWSRNKVSNWWNWKNHISHWSERKWHEIKHWDQSIQLWTQNSLYQTRLKEANNAWLFWSLAHDYAAGRLQVWIWWWGRWHNKKWGQFTWRDKI